MKIALINSLFFPSDNYHLINDYYDTSEAFFRTAKKNFLPNHDIHFILITNHSRKLDLNFVEHIVADYHPMEYNHLLFMKVLGLKFLTEEYDYVFVADADQIIVSEITDEDILGCEYVFMQHFCNILFKDAHLEMTNFIDCKYPENAIWTMGNFYGGEYKHVMNLYNLSQKYHDKLYQNSIMTEHNFYCKFPDELFITKYAYENEVNYKILSSNGTFVNNGELFLSDFSTNEEDYFYTKNVKILHNTKKDITFLKKITKKYE